MKDKEGKEPIIFKQSVVKGDAEQAEHSVLGSRETIARAKAEVEKQRSQYKSTLHLMIFFLSNTWNISLVLMAADFEQCFVHQYIEQVERCGTPEGAADWHMGALCGHCCIAAVESLAVSRQEHGGS
eukprot:4410165-Amphidinium_carterae.1